MPDTTHPHELSAIAIKIETHARAADENVLAAAHLLFDTKRRFDAGEFSDTTWAKWSKKSLTLGATRIRELLRIASADDPGAALEQQRAVSAQRQQKRRDNLERDAKKLIAWAHAAPVGQIKQVLAFVAALAPPEKAYKTPCPDWTSARNGACMRLVKARCMHQRLPLLSPRISRGFRQCRRCLSARGAHMPSTPKKRPNQRAKKTSRSSAISPRPASSSKLDLIATALKGRNGSTIPDLMKITGWQAHSVRGALAGALKKRGITITSERVNGQRRYRTSSAT
jgi:hypothetical protein